MRLKSFSLAIAALMLMVFNSCKKETVDVTDLLRSVPSSAAGVVVFNMEGMLEDAGCKINGHEIIPSQAIKDRIAKVSSSKQEDFMMLFSGDTGIEPKGAVVFYDANRAFLTFALYDVNKFCAFVNNKTQGSFTDAGSGVQVNGNIAVKGAQAWVCLTSGKSIDTDAIASYAGLSPSQSYVVTPMGENLLIDERDIRGWALINVFTDQMLSRRDKNMLTLGLGFLFEGAESVQFSVDFKKGEVEAEAVVLNDKGQPAKYQLPSDKIDVNTLKGLGETCDAMMAFTISPKLIKKFDQIGAAFGGALFGDLGDTFKNVDGTVGVIASGTNEAQSMNGVVTTKGDISQTLRDMISEYMGPVSMDGKLLRFSKGDVKGSLQVKECAEELKGCCLGLVVDASGYGTLGYQEEAPTGFKELIIKLKPESGGLEFDVEANTIDEKENALLTLLRTY